MPISMQKTKTKTSVAVALVTLSIVGAVAGYTVIKRNSEGGGNFSKKVTQNSSVKTPAPTTPTIPENPVVTLPVNPVTNPVVVAEPGGVVNLDNYPWPNYDSGTKKYFGLMGSGASAPGTGRTVVHDASNYLHISMDEKKYYKFTVEKSDADVKRIKLSFGHACTDDGVSGPDPRCEFYPMDIVVKRGSVPGSAEDFQVLDKLFAKHEQRGGYYIQSGEDFTSHPDQNSWYSSGKLLTATDVVILKDIQPGTYYVMISYPKRTAEFLKDDFVNGSRDSIKNQNDILRDLRSKSDTRQQEINDLNARIVAVQKQLADNPENSLSGPILQQQLQNDQKELNRLLGGGKTSIERQIEEHEGYLAFWEKQLSHWQSSLPTINQYGVSLKMCLGSGNCH